MKSLRKNVSWIITLVCVLMALSGCGGAEKSIAIAPHNEIMFMDEELTLYASVMAGDKDVTHEADVVWESSDISVAYIDPNGQIMPVSPGTVTITASLADDYEVKSTTSLTVGKHVKNVSLSENEVCLLLGSSKADSVLNVEISPAGAYYQGLIMESSDENVATVGSDGMIHAVAPGSAVITIRSEDPACADTLYCDVMVVQGVSEITLSEEALELVWKKSHTLEATVLPENANDPGVVWSSSDESVATVSETGKVTAVSSGQAEIRCTAVDGSEVYGSCTVNVVVPLKKITLPKEKTLLLIDSTEEAGRKQLIAAVTPENTSYPNVRWESSDPNIVTVDENGVVTAVSAGSVKITAYSTDPASIDAISASCEVVVGSPVKSVEIVSAPEKMAKKSRATLKAEVGPDSAFEKKVIWTSSDESVLKVDAKGNVTAVGVGKADIICTAQDGSGVSDQTTIAVYQAVTSIKLIGITSTEIFEGDYYQLIYNVFPEDASDKSIEWTSDNTRVATVDGNGKVTAHRVGKAVITGVAKDGSGKKCTFRVVVEPALPITVESLGFGIYNGNLLGITVRNYCSKKTIKNFNFDIELTSYQGGTLGSSGSYNLGSDVTISPNSTRTIKRTLSGVAWSQKVKITITGVKFSDGTYYAIPWSEQETWTFSRW